MALTVESYYGIVGHFRHLKSNFILNVCYEFQWVPQRMDTLEEI